MKSDGIDAALGLDEDEVTLVPSTVVMGPSDRMVPTVPEDDIEYARRNIRDAIDQTKEALATAIDVVTSSGAAKEIEALANLFDKFVAGNERLVNIVGKPAVKNGDGPDKVVNNTQNVMVVGTTDDLLKIIRRERGEIDNEDLLEDER